MSEVRVGQVRPTLMRRIGVDHMIVLPAQRAAAVSVRVVRQAIDIKKQMLAKGEKQCEQLRAEILDLESQVACFDALPIDRVEGDPEEREHHTIKTIHLRPVALDASLDDDPEPPTPE